MDILSEIKHGEISTETKARSDCALTIPVGDKIESEAVFSAIDPDGWPLSTVGLRLAESRFITPFLLSPSKETSERALCLISF